MEEVNFLEKKVTLFEIIVDAALKSYLNTQHSILTSFGENELTIREKIHELLNNTNELIGDLNFNASSMQRMEGLILSLLNR